MPGYFKSKNTIALFRWNNLIIVKRAMSYFFQQSCDYVLHKIRNVNCLCSKILLVLLSLVLLVVSALTDIAVYPFITVKVHGNLESFSLIC